MSETAEREMELVAPLDRLYEADQRFPLEVGPGHIFASAHADRETLHHLIAVARAAENARLKLRHRDIVDTQTWTAMEAALDALDEVLS